MQEFAVVMGFGVVGALLWSSRIRPRLQRLGAGDTQPLLLALYLIAVLVNGIVLSLLAEGTDLRAASLQQIMTVQAASNVTAVVALLVAARIGLSGGIGDLGLRRHDGPSAVLTAIAAWMLFVPLLSAVQLINDGLLQALGIPDGMQRNLELFLSDDGSRSALVWVSMVVLIPFCEEVIMRGALYGGLRRVLKPTTAMIVSALIFALLHEPSAALPVGLLGLFLAWLYERTGSLAVPCLVHGLQNGITLVLTVLYEPVT